MDRLNNCLGNGGAHISSCSIFEENLFTFLEHENIPSNTTYRSRNCCIDRKVPFCIFSKSQFFMELHTKVIEKKINTKQVGAVEKIEQD